MNNELSKNKKKVGRKPKADKAKYKYAFRLSEVKNAKFLALFDQSELSNKAEFSKRCVFHNEIKVTYYNKSVYDFYMKLTHFYSQFRAIETNYNQIVKILYRHFPERKAATYLYKLENQTIELAKLIKEITSKIQTLEDRYITKEILKQEEW